MTGAVAIKNERAFFSFVSVGPFLPYQIYRRIDRLQRDGPIQIAYPFFIRERNGHEDFVIEPFHCFIV
jgi:hypothetical protein